MAVEEFNLEALAKINGGRLAIAFEDLLREAEMDCKDRPALKDDRRITMTFRMAPRVADNGELDTVDMQIEIDRKLPKRRSTKLNMLPVRGGLVYNEMSPSDVHQLTLDMAPSPKKAADPEQEAQEAEAEEESDVG